VQVNKDKSQDCLDERAPSMQPAKAGDSAFRCMDCGEAIPTAQLMDVPATNRCIACQREIKNMGKWDWGMAE
jgi:hypothetical protein